MELDVLFFENFGDVRRQLSKLLT